MPQGISALLAFDEGADIDTNTEAMKEMMASVKMRSDYLCRT